MSDFSDLGFRRGIWIAAGAALIVIALYAGMVEAGRDLLTLIDGSLILQDFAYHLALVKSYWSSAGPLNIYSVDAQLWVLRESVGGAAFASMPVGMSPLVLYLWWPLTLFSDYSAYLIWLVFQSVLLYLPFFFLVKRTAPSVPILTLGLLLFSPVSLACITLGQTSFLACGLIGILILAKGAKYPLWKGLAALLLWIKPSYGLCGMALLVHRKNWKGLVFLLAALFAVFLAAHVGLGAEGLRSYLETLRNYQTGEFPLEHSQSVSYASMNTLKTVLLAHFDPEAASITSLWIFRILFIASFAAGGLYPISAFLLFSPNLGFYEDVLLAVYLLAAAGCGLKFFSVPVLVATLLFAGAINWNHLALTPLAAWLIKAGFILFALAFFKTDTKPEYKAKIAV